jgi:MarR family transcriptional regulator, organic hydroperoxide resistance regulator
LITFVAVKPQDTIDFHLRWSWTKLVRLYSQEADRRGIKLAYVYVLLHTEKSGTPSTKLGPRMGMEPTSLSRTLRAMEDLGLIERLPDETDGRSMRVFLTNDGIAARREARDLVVKMNERLSSLLGEETSMQLIESMQKLNEILDHPAELLDGVIPKTTPFLS